MAEADFTVDTLATYLHIAKPQVLKLVERGKLPGRRVGGDWRFSAAEIHHWLEERIGLSSDEELQEMEGALERADGDLESLSIASLLPIGAISIPLAARTRASVIGEMISTASQTGWLWDPEKMIDGVRTREELMPTAMDNGVALLHPRRPLSNILDRAFLALGRCDRGIPFGNSRGVLTDIFFLICSTDDRTHLRTLARLSRLLTDARFIDELRGAASAYDAHQVIVEFEESLT
jgi:PTS system nitrogen regulatory IIA component